MNKPNATMKDVAQLAGVSIGTVSRVINGLSVSETNKSRVNAAISELRYEINNYAKGLKQGRTGVIAVIVPNLHNPFFALFVNHIEAALRQRKLKTLLCCADGSPDVEIECVSMATQNKVDGIIALTYSDIGQYITEGIPMVVFDRFFDNRNIPRVASDNFSGGCLAVEKLVEFGCRHPVYVRLHSTFPGESDKRKDGYLYACKRFNIEPDYLDEVDPPESGKRYDLLKEFINMHRRPDGELAFDGIFSHTDYHAYMLKTILTQMGYRVPEDVQIIGFDGILKFGNESDDGYFVSTICQPVQALACKCVEILCADSSVTPPSLTLLPVKYEYGGTTKC